jgi:hypothetical protein
MNSDWDIYFKHKTKFYISKSKLEEKHKCTISFTILNTPDDCKKINASADYIIIVPIEDFALYYDLPTACGRPLNEVLILSNTVRQGTEFDFDNVNFKYAGDWNQTPVHNQVQHIGPKRWLFDFLVGHKDFDADYLFDAMQPVLDSCLYSYNFKHTPGLLRMETHITKILHKNQNYDYSTYMDRTEFISETNNEEKVKYHADQFDPFIDDKLWHDEVGEENTIIPKYTSRIVPEEIYNQSLATLVKECGWSTDQSSITPFLQLTEKTFKPIQYRRLMFLLGCKNANKIFEQIGFKYFGECPWDEFNDWKKRVQVYAEYINNLTQDDLLQMYESQKHIIKHNHEFANKPWASENLIWVLRKL